jgi:pimeloyl-ACP methyl ester carboxylesterase
MRQRSVAVRGAELALFEPAEISAAGPLLVWAHGWGQSHRDLLPLAQTMRRSGHSILLDLPGFGVAPPPPQPWGTADYADAIAEFLAETPAARRVWIAHSFGCRIGLQVAARHPELLVGVFLIAVPGLPPHRSLPQRARLAARRWAFRITDTLTPEGQARDRLRQRFGSADYRAAGPRMRPILVKAVSENLSEAARAVRCPTMLVYGDRDSETPLDIGERLGRLIPRSRLVVLRGFGHLDIVTEGRHQVAQLLGEFLETVA